MSEEERWLVDALAEHLGNDASSVVRQGIRKMAREEGIVYPGPAPKVATKKKSAPKR